MKKRSIAFGSIVVGGMLLVGCSDQSEEHIPSQKEVLAEIVNEVREDFKPKTGAFSKYDTVKEYIIGIADRWVNEAETSEMKEEVLNDALAYADYFQDEIAEMGLKEDFDKLDSIGSEIINLRENEQLGELSDKFYNQIGEILSQIDGTYVVKKHSPEDAERLAKLKEQTVDYTEYSSLEYFLFEISDGLQEPSIKRSKIANPESHLAYVTIPYVNYFENEITELGLNADFDELQLLADDVTQREHEEGTIVFNKHVNVFKDKLHEIIGKIHEESTFDDIPSWAVASNEILSEPLVKADENARIATWRARKIAFSFPNHLLSDDYETEEEKIHSKTFLLYSEMDFNHFFAEKAKDYEEIWARYDELKQYIEDVANEYQ